MGIDELLEKHGTLEQFSAAVWRASDDLMITPEEAEKAIVKYKAELAIAKGDKT